MNPKALLTLTTLFLLFVLPVPVLAQTSFRVMFYNTENLFDTVDNPEKEDDEFTPEGLRRWTRTRYRRKLNQIAKVISSAGEWDIPALVGLCEVENDQVLNELTRYSPLRKMHYRYVLTDSGDRRGINLALLYQRERFRYLEHHCIKIRFPDNPERQTRDILHVSGIVASLDTLDVFVCHFPSRREGQQATAPDRMQAARTLRSYVDSLFEVRARAQVVLMGDFNDEPSDASLKTGLQAGDLPGKNEGICGKQLYNPFLQVEKNSRTGTYKYRDRWNFLDQIIVSGNLLLPDNPLTLTPGSAAVFQPSFLLVEDSTHGGKRPKKTYHGYKYEGGYSDHLPVFIDLSADIPPDR